MKNKNLLLPLNLQYFAKNQEDDNHDDDNNHDDGQKAKNNDDGKGDESGKGSEKTFTQNEVNNMMTKEKNEGRKSVLNAIGVENVEDAQKAIEFFKKFNEAFSGEKSPEEIQKTLGEEKSKAEKRAELAESKLACVMAGVSKDSVDDVLAIAGPKVTDEKNLSQVIEEMKTQPKYSSFFSNADGMSEKDKGTGSDVGHGRDSGSGEKSNARRLAEANKSNKKSSSYFN